NCLSSRTGKTARLSSLCDPRTVESQTNTALGAWICIRSPNPTRIDLWVFLSTIPPTMPGSKQHLILDGYVKTMVENVAQCYQLHEAMACQIRQLGQVEQQEAYAAACLEWQQPDQPNVVPVEKHLRELFAERCETMMQSNPTTTKDRFVIAFACYAKLSCLGLLLDSHPQGDLIFGEALRVAMPRILSTQPHTLESLSQRQALPGYVKQALALDDSDDTPGSGAPTKPGTFLVEKSFEYLDSQASHSMTCLVHDCGTSHLIGDWFEVSRGSEALVRITQTEMREVWEARVTDPV
ncbi:hypothetical protein OG21DRAFT_1509762, partial [Imleria badia]